MKKLFPVFAVITSLFVITPSFGWDYDALFGSTVTPGQMPDQYDDACSAGVGDNDGSIGACAPSASAGPTEETHCNLIDDFGGKTGTWDCSRPLGDRTPQGLYAAQ